MCCDSLLRLWCCINQLLTDLLTCLVMEGFLLWLILLHACKIMLQKLETNSCTWRWLQIIQNLINCFLFKSFPKISEKFISNSFNNPVTNKLSKNRGHILLIYFTKVTILHVTDNFNTTTENNIYAELPTATYWAEATKANINVIRLLTEWSCFSWAISACQLSSS